MLRSKLDFDCLDDSFDDPDFDTKLAVNQDTSDDSEDVYSFVDESDFFNPFVKQTSNNSFCNPFHQNESVLPNQPVKSPPDGFNPFAASSPKGDKRVENGIKNVCSYCDVKFSSSYNLKQHMVSIHKIFSPGMKIFKCDFNKCNFVTGSRMMFVRHNHSKFVQTGGSIVKPSCPVCHVQFFNPSSLKRHMQRKKHNN